MRPRLQWSPIQRVLWTAFATAFLLWAASRGHARLVAVLAGLYLVVYGAGGGPFPWHRKRRDYFIYVVISLAVIAAIAVYAIIEVYRGL